jgi:hypothetical protein
VNLIKGVDLPTGGFGAAYGGRLSGAIGHLVRPAAIPGFEPHLGSKALPQPLLERARPGVTGDFLKFADVPIRALMEEPCQSIQPSTMATPVQRCRPS